MAPTTSRIPGNPWTDQLSAALDPDLVGDGSLKDRGKGVSTVLGSLNVYIRKLPEAERHQFMQELEADGRMLRLIDTAEERFGALQLVKKQLDYYKRQRP